MVADSCGVMGMLWGDSDGNAAGYVTLQNIMASPAQKASNGHQSSPSTRDGRGSQTRSCRREIDRSQLAHKRHCKVNVETSGHRKVKQIVKLLLDRASVPQEARVHPGTQYTNYLFYLKG